MIRVGVIRGGVSTEHDVSLASGAHVLECLRSDTLKDRYTAIDIYIDKHGVWHYNGLPLSRTELPYKVDVIFNALHGEYGEDGRVQKELEECGIPYTGSGVLASSLGYNKAHTKQVCDTLGILTPKHILYPAYQKDFDGPRDAYALQKAREVVQSFPPPYIVKPLTGGSSMGIHVCKTFDDVVRAFRVGVGQNVSILVEELIVGREASIGVIEGFRGQDVYILPSTEIRISKDKPYFDYTSKYTQSAHKICPGVFSLAEKEMLGTIAGRVHAGLGLAQYSQVECIIHPEKGIYVIEVNTLPGLTKESLLTQQLHAVGSSLTEFIDHSISRVRK